MINQIKNIYLRRLALCVAAPLIIICVTVLYIAWWFYEGFKGFSIYSKDVYIESKSDYKRLVDGIKFAWEKDNDK